MKRAVEELGYDRTYHGMEGSVSSDGFIWSDLVDLKYGPHPRPINRDDFDRYLAIVLQ